MLKAGTHGFACAVLAAAAFLAVAAPARAKILKTKRPSQFKEYHPFNLTVGSGIEYEGDSEEKQYDFPFLVEYQFTDKLTVTVEPDYLVLKRSEGTIKGFGDLETEADYEFVSERRSRPSIAAEVLVKWATATSDSLTTGENDYSVGAIFSKEFIHFDIDSEWLYTLVGDPPGVDLTNSSEISLAVTWHLTHAVDFEGEGVTSSGGGFHGTTNLNVVPSEIGTNEREYEATLGFAEMLGRLKLEEGVVIKSDGSQQYVAAWEWNFGEE